MSAPVQFGYTSGGLPYPESTEDLNQGANAIKALALAVDGRGGGFLSARGYNQAAPFSGGRTTINLPAGFTTLAGIIVTPAWGGSTGTAEAPLTLGVETWSAGSFGLIALRGPRPGVPGDSTDWFTGTCGIFWWVWGT